jgi:hypothetical protein
MFKVAFSMLSVTRLYIDTSPIDNPCGGRVEYLHRDPASGRRRRKEKSQVWESKIWLRDYTGKGQQHVQKTVPSSRQRGRPTKKQDRNCQTVINIWSWASDGARQQDLLTYWPSVAMWLWLLNQQSPHHWKFSKVHAGPRFAHGL